MDDAGFFGLERDGSSSRFHLPVVRELCAGTGALFGGAGLGASIEALEAATGRPVVWATAQFLAFVRPPATLQIEVTEAARGHHVSQARAVAAADGREILTVNATLGRRTLPWSGSWAQPPDVPPPEACPPRPLLEQHRGSIHERLETRLARARELNEDDEPQAPGDGRASLWARLADLPTSAAALAIVGDFVPFGIGQALGRRTAASSLDNTLRVAMAPHPTEWILADVRVHAVADGFGHGLVHLWADDGTLLGTASQSAIVRELRAS